MRACSLLLVVTLLATGLGCSHGSHAVREEPNTTWAARSENCNSAATRIWALISNGQFAEAQVLIAESQASGLIAAPLATQMLHRINLLTMKVGQLPATLQRPANFPSQLKDYTLFEVKQMLDRKDFSMATKAQLNMLVKILQNPKRLMEKL